MYKRQSSNPAERVLREVGRILRTYCHNNQKEWQKYLASTEVFLNISYHQFTENTPYLMMFGKKPHREIQDLINFPVNPEDPYDENHCYNRIMEKIEKQRAKVFTEPS